MLFVALPYPENIPAESVLVMMSNLMLMKLGGQQSVSRADLHAMARDYAGFLVVYDPATESFTATMRTRPEEFPDLPSGKGHDV